MKGLFMLLSSTGGDHHPHITVEGATDLDPDLDPIHLVSSYSSHVKSKFPLCLNFFLRAFLSPNNFSVIGFL